MAPISLDVQRNDLVELLESGQLSALFQPIAGLGAGEILGYEGLIRGPSTSYLHSPINLFSAASRCGLLPELDFACRRAIIHAFVKAGLSGRLFLNVSPICLTLPSFRPGATLEILREAGLSPQRIVIELTETQPAENFDLLFDALLHYRDMGFQIALDDLGEGFSGLRLWSELQPDFVKIDKYFIQDMAGDPQKRQFVRSIQHIAVSTGARVIAEGVENREDLEAIRRIGIDLVQGYLISRPQANPLRKLPAALCESMQVPGRGIDRQTAISLLTRVEPAAETETNNHIYERFSAEPDLHAIPVVDSQNIPVGLLKRHIVLERFARPFCRELYGHRPCAQLMDQSPLIVEHGISLQELSSLVTSSDRRYLADGFIITEGGAFLGMGSGQDLMRAITELQMRAARHANPLTLLPGNVPIQEEIQSLLARGQCFVAVYADLGHFKPFNDIYGYDRGDELIKMLGELLQGAIDPSLDFIGHIGGDDFLVLFQSENWRERCAELLAFFNRRIREYFSPEHLRAGGYSATNRQGQPEWCPLVSLSLGAVEIEPEHYASHHEIATAAAMAKKMAKSQPGSSLFIERRRPDSVQDAKKPTGIRLAAVQ
ncbi:diguanylate cyclase (GGDEF) domain-containing protein [Formivibrio citricus]|uniref:Diguanylate cyclase (GGDEF) domain-containing protein n=1 Tax=Formivibrio citricus TaxID=83765 RepID=A0A1I4UYY3_9NEIS|nr:GGDEF domain-containing protein [Formivibrio citricus]SFM94194.1 diguanylate cyclase (GGDEF) domain-containing protein [Formivibrio citricus]